MLGQGFIHLKHINCIYTKKIPQCFITIYISLILWILQVVLPDICPKFLHNLEQNTDNTSGIMIKKLQDCMNKSVTERIQKNHLVCRYTSVLANSGTPTNFWSRGDRAHSFVKPPPLFLPTFSTLFDLRDKLKNQYLASSTTETCSHNGWILPNILSTKKNEVPSSSFIS